MTSAISQTAMIRGADGRLFSVSAQGVTEVAEQAANLTATPRVGERRGYGNDDHQAGRFWITPGL